MAVTRDVSSGKEDVVTARLEPRLRVPADGGVFDDAEVSACDAPVRRYFRAAIAPGTPLARAAWLRMRGSIKLGRRWVRFRAEELLEPLHGYDWPAKVAGGLVRGADTYVDGRGSMHWRFLGLVPIVRSSGPDVDRSAMGRSVAEGIWLPTALLPRHGVIWRAENEEQLVAEVPIGAERVTLYMTIDSDGRVRSAHLKRCVGPAVGFRSDAAYSGGGPPE